jgi:hypothetical protein
MANFIPGISAQWKVATSWGLSDFSKTALDSEISKQYSGVLKAGVSLEDNINTAKNYSFLKWYNAVKTTGGWDYKNDTQLPGLKGVPPKIKDSFGNFNFGAVAAAKGFTLQESLLGAGAYQVLVQGGGSFTDLAISTTEMAMSAVLADLPSIVPMGSIFSSNQSMLRQIQAGNTFGDNPGDSENIAKGWCYEKGGCL